MADLRSKPLRSLTINPTLLTTASDKELSIKHHTTLPLAIINYTTRKGRWDDLSLAARSLVVETTSGKIVSHSLNKFFNYHEKAAYKPTGCEHAFVVEEKVDGSLISLFHYRGEWMIISRTAFEENSPHAVAARKVLDARYPGVLRNFDREKTYVFELVHPKLPVKIHYEKEDLYILAVVSKDGSEQLHNFDWSTSGLPFPRPRIHATVSVIPKQLSQLNIPNEEGFVVKYWSTPEDRYPERVKVKFESYLLGGATKSAVASVSGDSKSRSTHSSTTTTPTGSTISHPPSNAKILEMYTKNRLTIYHFNAAQVSSFMAKHKHTFLSSLESIADDYGGQLWLDKIANTWDRIDALFSLQEYELVSTISTLQREGFKPNVGNANSTPSASVLRSRFERRLASKMSGVTIEKGMREVLMGWYLASPVAKQVECFVTKNVQIPADLRSTEVIAPVLPI